MGGARGAKGCGEAGTTFAPAAIMNALEGALTLLGIVDIDMPATSERVQHVLTSFSKCQLIDMLATSERVQRVLASTSKCQLAL